MIRTFGAECSSASGQPTGVTGFFIRRARLLQGRELLLEIVDVCSVARCAFLSSRFWLALSVALARHSSRLRINFESLGILLRLVIQKSVKQIVLKFGGFRQPTG